MDDSGSDRLYPYYILTTDALPIGAGVREERERLAGLDLTEAERARLAELDSALLEEVADREGEVDASVLADDVTRDLNRWWWHLGALRSGRYPVALLPPHLERAYRLTRGEARRSA
ncbi:hypothetical protein [Endothiovibrio diazotrophicus]